MKGMEDTNPRLPSWSGDWSTFKAYELKVGFEIDSTKKEDRVLLGPKLAKNLGGKAWELLEEVNREELRKERGAEYLLAFLRSQRGRDKVDLMGDALRDFFQKADVSRKEGEEFVEYIPRYRSYVKAIENALKDLPDAQSMPTEFYGWYLLTMGMNLEPSDVANIKARTASYKLADIENTIKTMWSGGGLAQKDQDRKRWKSMGKNYLAQSDQHGVGVYEVKEEHEPNQDDYVDQADQEQFEDLAAAMLENPDDDSLLIAYQEAKKKMQYKEARKMLTKSRTSREFYPVKGRSSGGKDGGDKSTGGVPHFDGDCMRCGKYGHKARFCPQKNPKNGKVNIVQESEPSVENYAAYPLDEAGLRQRNGSGSYVVFNEGMNAEKIYAALNEEKQFKAIVDSGASETIVGVDTLQDLYDIYNSLGFEARQEITVDRNIRKTFVFGNSEVSEAIGLARINVGILGKEIEAHVVDGTAPLLLSSKFLYEHEVVVDFKEGHAYFPHLDVQAKLQQAPSYHLLLSILGFPGNKQACDDVIVEEEDPEGVSPTERQPEC